MMRGVRAVRATVLLAVALCVGATAGAQTTRTTAGPDVSVLSTLKWRNVGPARGGRSIAVAGSLARPQEYYFGATGGGLWKTIDGGLTWTPVGDGQFKTSSVGAVAVAASNPDVVYVGFGEVQLRGNIIQGDGVYRSTDGGKTFTSVGLEATRAIGRIRVHPTNPDVVWVAALGEPYARTADRGVYKSSDGGKAWRKVLFRDEGTGAVDLVVDPSNPEILYASLWEVSRTPHSLSSGGPGSGLFKSFDGGTTWTEISRRPGLPGGLLGRIGVSVSGVDANRVYAIIEAADGGLFSTDDGGLNWTRVSEDRNIRQRAFYYTRVYADPKSRDTVYVLNVQFHTSTDGGKTFKPIRVPHGDNHDLWIAPDNPQRMVQANDGGANVSLNGGQSWTGQQYPTAQFYNAFTTSDVPYMICGAQQDNSTACISSNGPASDFYPVGGGESGYIAQSNVDPDEFFAGSYGGMLTRYNRRAGWRAPSTSGPTTRWGTPRAISANASSGPIRSCSRRSRRASCTRHPSTCGAAPRVATDGRRSVPTSRGTTRRRWGHREARSPSTRPASRRMPRSSPSLHRASSGAFSGPAVTTVSCTSRGTPARRGSTSRLRRCPTSRASA